MAGLRFACHIVVTHLQIGLCVRAARWRPVALVFVSIAIPGTLRLYETMRAKTIVYKTWEPL